MSFSSCLWYLINKRLENRVLKKIYTYSIVSDLPRTERASSYRINRLFCFWNLPDSQSGLGLRAQYRVPENRTLSNAYAKRVLFSCVIVGRRRGGGWTVRKTTFRFYNTFSLWLNQKFKIVTETQTKRKKTVFVFTFYGLHDATWV